MAADYVTNVNLGFEQLETAHSSGHLCCHKSFMTMDNISIMYRNLCYVAS